MGHYSWFTHLDLIEYDHIIGSLIVFAFLFLVSRKIKSSIEKSDSGSPVYNFSLRNVLEILSIVWL